MATTPSLTTLQTRAIRELLRLMQTQPGTDPEKPIKWEIQMPLVDDRYLVVSGTTVVQGGRGSAPPPPPPPPLTPPLITTQPRGASTVPGATVTITASFSGSAPLTVQWLRNDVLIGSPVVASGNSASITTSALTLDDNGDTYKLRVTNSVGTVTSDAALVVVVSTTIPSGVYVEARKIPLFNAILIEGGFVSSRYERGQTCVEWTGTGNKTVEVKAYQFDGGNDTPLVGTNYTLLIDGVPHSTVTRSGTPRITFTVDRDTLPEGWHLFDVMSDTTQEGTIPLFIYMRHGAEAVEQELMPVLVHSHDMLFPVPGFHEDKIWQITQADRGVIHWGMVPARFQPTINPLPPRTFPDAGGITVANQMVCTQLAPSRMSDIHRTTRMNSGLLTTSGTQYYHWSDFTAKVPIWQIHDGPRGEGTVAAATHLQIGRDGKIYGLDPWRFFRVDTDGHVTTLAGFRHTKPARNPWESPRPTHPTTEWTDIDGLELVGDWSAIPPERRGMHETWGMAWLPSSLTVNESVPPIPEEGNEHPHNTGPVAFITDTQNNRVLRVEFSPISRSVPAKVTEFLTGLGDPWDCACSEDGILYVSERTSHRVMAYNAYTGAVIKTVIQGPDLGFVDANRGPQLRFGVSQAQADASPCLLPEGIFLMGDSLYFGALKMGRVTELNRHTSAVIRTQAVHSDGNSKYVKFAVSDGTFGPHGTIFSVTWSNRKYGYPHAFIPPESIPPNYPFGNELSFFGAPNRGHIWADGGYTTSVTVGQGRMLCSYVQEGLTMVSKFVLPQDELPPNSASLRTGAYEYWKRGFRTLYGNNGWGHYGLPLPWGVTPEIDIYLTYCGHVRPTP
jgi:hypothetical protein